MKLISEHVQLVTDYSNVSSELQHYDKGSDYSKRHYKQVKGNDSTVLNLLCIRVFS